jgi:cytoskeletal protein RodZ
MNTHDLRPEPDPVDLLASARLDGDPSPPLGDQDPVEVAARQEELRSVAALLGEAVTIPPSSVVDAQIAQAIANLDADESAAGAADGVPEPVIPLAPRASRRSDHRRWLAVAAAIVVVALAGAVVASNRSHSSSSDTAASPVGGSATSSSSTPASPGASQPTTREAESRSEPSSSTATDNSSTSGGGLPDLGAVASDASLGAEVLAETSSRATLDSTTAPTTLDQATPSTVAVPVSPFSAPPVVVPTCDQSVRAAVPGLGPLVFAATATYQGIPVQVLVYADGQPTSYRLIAAQAADCAILVDRPL